MRGVEGPEGSVSCVTGEPRWECDGATLPLRCVDSTPGEGADGAAVDATLTCSFNRGLARGGGGAVSMVRRDGGSGEESVRGGKKGTG